jgi:hypothetical protein
LFQLPKWLPALWFALDLLYSVYPHSQLCRVADQHHSYADPDPAFHFKAEPDLAFHFKAEPDLAFHLIADPDPAFRFVSDPDPPPLQSDGNLRPQIYTVDTQGFILSL